MFNFAILDKHHTIAGRGFNRWLVPPAALAVHLCIGMAYGFSVFWLPLSKMVGTACAKDVTLLEELFTTSCDWKIASLGWMYILFFVFLGSSAAVFGRWVEHEGPRKAAFVSAVCWCGGLVISSIGVYYHQLWLMWLGSGVIGGIGLGLGYISPVSTLVKWFPDRRGMATGMAIMGFGGGAMIGSPLAVQLMNKFADGANNPGVWQTFLVMALLYSIFMFSGSFGYRVPSPGWKPEGWQPPNTSNKSMITKGHVHVSVAWKTPQFWLIWIVLCMNVSAGIGIIGIASPMLQEIFGGKLIGLDIGFNDLDEGQKKQIAVLAGAFTGLLSLFNILGRFFWASLSDIITRKVTYIIFLGLGLTLYYLVPSFGHSGNLGLFILAFAIILSMYGGGFATVPAYLADMFGTQMVGAIHGRLLTAWSTAGVLGPVVVNYIRESELAAGVPREQLYDKMIVYLVGMLAVGFVANLLIRPVDSKYFMTDEELAKVRASSKELAKSEEMEVMAEMAGEKTSNTTVAIAWIAVGIPLAWGFFVTIEKTLALFR